MTTSVTTSMNFNELTNICKNIASDLHTMVEIDDYKEYGWAAIAFMTDKFGGTYINLHFDHKTGEVIYDAISGAYAGATIDEKYSNAKITAVVDGATGNLVKLTVEFDIDVAIDIGIGSGTATATTHIIYTDFKY